jgi:hypothetical protein
VRSIAFCTETRDNLLTKELLEAEAEEAAANFAAAADGAALQQIQVRLRIAMSMLCDCPCHDVQNCIQTITMMLVQAVVTENRSLQQKLIDDRTVAAASAAAAAAEHGKQIAAMQDEIADLRLLCSAASSAENIVASLTDENAALVGAVHALQSRIIELEEVADISRM